MVSIGTYQYENQRHVIISQKNYLKLKLEDVQNKILILIKKYLD